MSRPLHVSTKVFLYPDNEVRTSLRRDYASVDFGGDSGVTIFFMPPVNGAETPLASLDNLIGKLEVLRAEMVGEPVPA